MGVAVLHSYRSRALRKALAHSAGEVWRCLSRWDAVGHVSSGIGPVASGSAGHKERKVLKAGNGWLVLVSIRALETLLFSS